MEIYDPYKSRSLYEYNFDDEELQLQFERQMKIYSKIFSQEIPIDTPIGYIEAKGIVNRTSKTSLIYEQALAIFTNSSAWTWYTYGDDHRGLIADQILKKYGGNIQRLAKGLKKFLDYWYDPEAGKRSYNIVYYAYLKNI